MKYFRPVLLAAALSVAVLPAAAQRAPISQGATSSGLASQVEQVRIQNAEMRIQMGGMVEDMQTLTGKVETLQFLLSQSRDGVNALQEDNQQLAQQVSSLRGTVSKQDEKIKSLEGRLAGSTSSSAYGNTSGSYTGRTTTGAGSNGSVTIIRPGTSDTSESASSSPYVSTPSPRRLTGSTANTNTGATVSSRSATVNSGLSKRSSSTSISGGAAAPSDVSVDANSSVQGGGLGTIAASQLPGEAGPLFADAKSKLLKFEYPQAETAFRAFLEQFSGDPQAGEAQYWLGEVLYQQKAYAESGKAYTQMIRAYPKDPRAPDALVKLARSMRLVGDSGKACLALNTLPKQYPNASGVTKDLAAVERTRSGCDS